MRSNLWYNHTCNCNEFWLFLVHKISIIFPTLILSSISIFFDEQYFYRQLKDSRWDLRQSKFREGVYGDISLSYARTSRRHIFLIHPRNSTTQKKEGRAQRVRGSVLYALPNMYAWCEALTGWAGEKEILSRHRHVNDRDAFSVVKEDHVVSYKCATANRSRVSLYDQSKK